MSLLTSKPPKTVRVGGEEIPIDPDFRLWVHFHQSIIDGDMDDAAMNQFLRRVFEPAAWGKSVRALGEALLWFYRRGKEPKKSEGADDQEPEEIPEPVIDFEIDAERITAAFQREYRIDLTTEELHWWRFRALLDDLLTRDKLTDVVMFRATPMDKVPKEQKSYYRAKKEAYALCKNQPETLEERDYALVEQLRKAAMRAGALQDG